MTAKTNTLDPGEMAMTSILPEVIAFANKSDAMVYDVHYSFLFE